MRALFDHAESLTPHISSFWFKPERPVRFEPGQFLELYLPHDNMDARGDRREFSISSLPGELLISFTTNFALHKDSSFKHELRKLKPGTVVAMAEPMGDFVLPKDPSIRLVFVAIGLGCTAYISMIKWLAKQGDQRNIQFIYSVRQPKDILFSTTWQSYPLAFCPIISRPVPDWRGETGRLSVDNVIRLVSPLDEKLIYLAGPQSIIEPLFNDLLATGVARRQLVLDYFPGY